MYVVSVYENLCRKGGEDMILLGVYGPFDVLGYAYAFQQNMETVDSQIRTETIEIKQPLTQGELAEILKGARA